ncbi:hypothetical protein AJ80_07910 [Polytolypa hystricis UAMH7299]|uniref:STAS domain-containing protein n=1 Tax=Polytolypa hystricis (strain UAMH7299) TaxID=1447883 RepID=A0A2B7XG50_POLH7|nr:hypothetical protein AJ80_07910 [Polytolypa hystricis UAMH7299]
MRDRGTPGPRGLHASVAQSCPQSLHGNHNPSLDDTREDESGSVHEDSNYEFRPSSSETTGTTGSSPRKIPYSTAGNEKTPARSFYHRSFHGALDAGHYSSHGVRERTAELASLALSEGDLSGKSYPPPRHDVPASLDLFAPAEADASDRYRRPRPEPIEELAEPRSPTEQLPRTSQSAASALTAMIMRSPTSDEDQQSHEEDTIEDETPPPPIVISEVLTEETPLMRKRSRTKRSAEYGTSIEDIEGQDQLKRKKSVALNNLNHGLEICRDIGRDICNPRAWSRRTIWKKGIVYPASFLPSVMLGLLLNILDALSYGMILFPLGEPIFAHLGADGISMFYVSTIISQLVFSCGGSIFKGGVGSEMIEVVPFFHKMALMILARVGEENVKSVYATTILSYAISSVLTGTVFFLMGACGLGSLIGFFPRHILIGCIGGVGWFLVATGVEVSARFSGNFEYNLDTLWQLFQPDTVSLWTSPLVVAIGLLFLKRFVKSNFLVGGYFLSVGALFYLVKLIFNIPLDTLRAKGWVFEVQASSEPWYNFYTLYDISAVNWSALADTIPTMFALTFFGILHVPINVPALGISTGEDNLNVDRELIAHGISNALSGFAGSIQNYLVYTNSLLFIDSGGNSRLAGIMLAFATVGVLFAGPVIIGFIPVMVVGALIYMLGIELMEEALVDTWGKLHRLEYLTIVIIVVTMGAWDFVAGIVIGIILACVNFVAQTSRKSAITATYSGQIAISTVRRHPLHVRFLKEAGQQTCVIKLAGFLFFGTIVSVEKRIRGLIEEDVFKQRPIRFLVLDLSHVNGLDFSAAEAFTRLNRILRKRMVHVIVCGLDVGGEVGRSLQNVGLFRPENKVEIFEDLNSALEYCENELLKVLYRRKDAMIARNETPSGSRSLEVTKPRSRSITDTIFNSPRGRYLHDVATSTLREEAESSGSATYVSTTQRWTSFQQPLPLLLQTFHGLTAENEDFWFPACAYFSRAEFPTSSILYREGDTPENFYLLESGMLRAEYRTPQGSYFELVVAGRPCGELPFFGETRRTATVRAERDCVVWCLSREKWMELRAERPLIAQELLRVCLKLTAERMESITS